jgi:hypothetical protein
MMIENVPKEKMLGALQDGPTLPIKIARKVGGDTMIIGAILSTLISSGDVAVSSLKIGGSPLYFIPGQEEKLEGFIDHLNEKDQKTFKLLKEKKILSDSEQDPLIRVSLRAIKDFAKSFEIDNSGKKEVFWRFYSHDKDEAVAEAKKMLSERPAIEMKEEPKQESKVVIEYKIEHMPDTGKQELKELPKRHRKEHKKEEHKQIEEKESEEELFEEKKEESKEAKKGRTETKEEVKKEETEEEQKAKEEKSEKKDFYAQIKDHIHKLGLDIISKEKTKKTEYALILKNHDTNEYIYCVAKDKKTINEGDLSTAFVFSHNKRMPCIFLTTGSLNKKADSMLHKEFKDMKIEKIE